MITQYDIEKFYKDVAALRLKFPHASIVKATGEPGGNVSAYLNKVRDPTEPFLKKFYEKFGESLKNVPRETQETQPEPTSNSDESIYLKKYIQVLEEKISIMDSKNGVQGINSNHPGGNLNLAELNISEADRGLLGVLSSLIENGFALQSSKLDTMKAELIEEIQKGSATVRRKGGKG